MLPIVRCFGCIRRSYRYRESSRNVRNPIEVIPGQRVVSILRKVKVVPTHTFCYSILLITVSWSQGIAMLGSHFRCEGFPQGRYFVFCISHVLTDTQFFASLKRFRRRSNGATTADVCNGAVIVVFSRNQSIEPNRAVPWGFHSRG